VVPFHTISPSPLLCWRADALLRGEGAFLLAQDRRRSSAADFRVLSSFCPFVKTRAPLSLRCTVLSYVDFFRGSARLAPFPFPADVCEREPDDFCNFYVRKAQSSLLSPGL